MNIDYHVQVNHIFYSVPYRFYRKKMDVCIGQDLVKCYYKNLFVATHARMQTKGSFSTNKDHMPEKHRRYQDRERLLRQARAVGPETVRMVETLLERRSCQEQNFCSVLGVLELEENYSAERLEVACRIALSLSPRGHNYPTIASILQHNRDFLLDPAPHSPQIQHENLRGGEYYASKPNSTSTHATSSSS